MAEIRLPVTASPKAQRACPSRDAQLRPLDCPHRWCLLERDARLHYLMRSASLAWQSSAPVPACSNDGPGLPGRRQEDVTDLAVLAAWLSLPPSKRKKRLRPAGWAPDWEDNDYGGYFL